MASDTYRYLAKYYDHLFEARRSYTTARKAILNPLLPKVESACDLCCGTGSFALQLARKGIRTFAVDLSPDMCRITRLKAKAAKLKIEVIEADMRTFQLPQGVDLITCEYDALNHVPRKQDLPRVLRTAAKALNPGGYFVFDLNNRAAFASIWSKTWFMEKDPVALVMQSTHVPGSDKASCNVEWFVRTGKIWKRYSERIEEVCWSAAEIRKALKEAGFDQIQTWDASPFFKDSHTPPGNRTFWRARKK